VVARWNDGSRLKGWVEEKYLKTSAETVLTRHAGQSVHATIGCADPPRLVPVAIRDGAEIAEAPNGAVWAHTTRRVTARALPAQNGDEWIRIATMPGLPAEPCAEHRNLWVRARDVRR
jgi:hypothetical protein